ncbi:MAG: hypothetical protein ACRDV4_03305 [Acidimicrobiales bacterium]
MKFDGFELLRQLFQDHLDLRAEREGHLEEVVGADGITRTYAEEDHQRPLVTIFGELSVRRLAYRRKKAANLHPADAGLNLPQESYSHGLRAVAATEAARGSLEEAVAAIARATAVLRCPNARWKIWRLTRGRRATLALWRSEAASKPIRLPPLG